MKVAIIGTYPPRQCGIATFTHDLFKSICQSTDDAPAIIAVSDQSETHFPKEVAYVIERNRLETYFQAAQFIDNHFDACIIQHEYGIFGGACGSYILQLAAALHVPIVSNLHTVLQHPTVEEKNVLQKLATQSKKITVMTKRAVHMLTTIYDVEQKKISKIPHGVPQFRYTQQEAKTKLGLANKKIMLSFGFLGPSKGFETAIEAVASIPDPDFVYIILGSTHPNIIKMHGEAYRESLMEKVQTLGIADKIQFINQFASDELLNSYLSACDIYVTPYPNAHQISSGTLSFAIGAGAAVISTPYWYAKDLLANGRGLFFDFKDSKGLANVVNQLLGDPKLLSKYRKQAANYGKHMSWTNIGKLQLQLLNSLIDSPKKTYFSLPNPVNDLRENMDSMLTPQQKLSF